jgi:hypothetical protein
MRKILFALVLLFIISFLWFSKSFDHERNSVKSKMAEEPITTATSGSSTTPNPIETMTPQISTISVQKGDNFTTILSRASSDKTSPLCFYQVQNFCISGNDQDGFLLVFFNLEQNSHSLLIGTEFSSKKLRLCNELRKKFNLPFQNRFDDVSSSVLVSNNNSAHIMACWQFYGYHLFQCSVAAFFAQEIINKQTAKNKDKMNEITSIDLWFYNHAVSLPKASRDHYSHKMFLGSESSWLDGNYSLSSSSSSSTTKTKKEEKSVLNAPLWGLWAVNALSMKREQVVVKELLHLSGNVQQHTKKKIFCYKQGIIGQPVHHVVPNEIRLLHVAKLKEMYGLNKMMTPLNNKKKKILISQRGFGSKQGSRKIANLDFIVNKLASNFAEQFDVSVVDFAAMNNFQEQIKIAHEANILIATHGAGNIWLAFLSKFESSSSPLFVELWPQETVARDVYQIMCKQYGVRYSPIFAKMKPLFSKPEEVKFSFLHQDVEVPWKELEEILKKE